MNILFITIAYPKSPESRNIYSDLMEEFVLNGHNVTVVCSLERRYGENSRIEVVNGISILWLKALNITQTKNWIEKGLSMILLPYLMIRGIKKFFHEKHFDLLLFSTPPITYSKTIKYIKNKYHSIAYLLLKDITPQNAVDMGLIKKNSFLWKYFRHKEKQLYEISDFIGCMSPANIQFLLKDNPQISPEKVNICANSMRIREVVKINKELIRNEFDIPTDRIVLLYGGNLGKPQGINFLLEILQENRNNANIFFLIIGHGTEYPAIKNNIDKNKYTNVKLINYLPKNKYNAILQIADIGLVLLDKKFTIPNFPGRVLDYMEFNVPIIAATDTTTDVGLILEKNNCGFGVLHGDLDSFQECLDILLSDTGLRKKMGFNARSLFEREYSTEKAYSTILKCIHSYEYS